LLIGILRGSRRRIRFLRLFLLLANYERPAQAQRNGSN